MKIEDLETIFRSLQDAGASYLIVGGMAVIAHGYVRMTEDLDLVLDLRPESVAKSLRALESLGYRPLVPVPIHDFANPELRKDWIEHRHMKVFNLVSDRFPEVTIDIFPREPFVFDTELALATWHEIADGVQVPVVSVSTLITMKLEADRTQDRADIEKLRRLHGGSS